MKIFLTLTLLLLTIIPTNAAKKVEANPINIAAIIVEKTDSAKIASTLEYYGYSPSGTENGYQVMKHSNGTEIRFTFTENGVVCQYPTVIVKHNTPTKDIDTRLKTLDFESKGNSYKREKNQFSRYITQCQHGPKSTLIFRRTQR